MAEGRSNAGIAKQLIIGVKTVEKFIASIFEKLELRSDESSQNRRVLAVLSYLRAQQGPQLLTRVRRPRPGRRRASGWG